jgi:hypothetical protein
MDLRNFKSTEALYGVSPCYFDKMSYYEAIKEKVKLAHKRIKELSKRCEPNTPDYSQITFQITECYKALKFNKNLLKEREKWRC